MGEINKQIDEYNKLVKKGDIVAAYGKITGFATALKNKLSVKYPDYAVSAVYYGYMDMTYFAFTPPDFKAKGLKIAIVYTHGKGSYEIWLSGANRKVQSEYYQIFKDNGYNRYPLIPQGAWVDSVIECVITPNPDYEKEEELTSQIESGAMEFITHLRQYIY